MKLYRVVPDPFDKKIELFPDIRKFEGMYNLGGYATFTHSGRVKEYFGANSIYSALPIESKYFFIFPEDAIRCSNSLFLTDFIRLVEYEIPYELVIKHAGIGRYGGKILKDGKYIWPIGLETAVEKYEFGREFFDADSFSKDERKKLLLQHYKETLNLLKYYENIDICGTDEDLVDSEEFEDVYFKVWNINYALVKSKLPITNVYGLSRFDEEESELKDKTCEYLKNKGLILDYSKEATEERNYITADLNGVDETLCMFNNYAGNRQVRQRLCEYIYNKKLQ